MNESSQSSSFVPGFEHDLFVSYAHVDDKPAFEVKWVSALVGDLRTLLARRLGRLDSFSLWWDQINLRGNHAVTPKIRGKVQESATLLLVLSPGYLNSTWCLTEMNLFLKELQGELQGRVFVVEMQALDDDQAVPEGLSDFKKYRFWYADEHDQPRTLSIREPEPHATEYARLVGDLAKDISDCLKTLKPDTPAVPVEPEATVYLAEVTEDLDPRREEVRRYLEDERLRVLPARRYLEGQAFREALDEDLPQCEMFVQLLGEVPGRRPPDVPQGYARLQLERAEALGVPIFQWRNPDLVVDKVTSTDQRDLL